MKGLVYFWVCFWAYFWACFWVYFWACFGVQSVKVYSCLKTHPTPESDSARYDWGD